jgi:hypothetical protein
VSTVAREFSGISGIETKATAQTPCKLAPLNIAAPYPRQVNSTAQRATSRCSALKLKPSRGDPHMIVNVWTPRALGLRTFCRNNSFDYSEKMILEHCANHGTSKISVMVVGSASPSNLSSSLSTKYCHCPNPRTRIPTPRCTSPRFGSLHLTGGSKSTPLGHKKSFLMQLQGIVHRFNYLTYVTDDR